MKRIIPLLCLLLLAALPSRAALFSLSDESRAAKRARAADRAMERAENALDAKDYRKAADLFAEAIENYRKTEEAVPGYKDNLPEIRIRYCSEQLTNAVLAIEGATLETLSEPSPAAREAAEVEKEAPPARPAAGGTPPPAGTPDKDLPPGPEGESAAEAFARVTGQPQPAPLSEAHAEPAPAAQPAARGSGEQAPAPARTEQADAGERPVADAAKADAQEEPPAYDPRDFVHDYNEARELLESGKTSEAASLVIPLLRYDPSNRSVRILLALIRTQQGRYEEAIVALENLRGRRDDLPLLLALSGAYTGAGRYHDALLALDSAMRLAPSDPAAYLNSAWLTLIMPPSGPNTLKNAEAYYRMAISRGASRDRALERRLGLTKW